jgi:hypothetical protein
MDQINRNFLWGDIVSQKKIHLLNWDTISRPKEEGGLGIKKSKCRNIALLAKRTWTLRLGSNEVWIDIFRCKYNYNRSIPQRKSIIFRSLCMANMVCDKGKGWLIRNDHSINFWHDNWLGSGTLREKISGPLNLHEESLKLCDLWDANNNWCLENISCSLSSSLIPNPRRTVYSGIHLVTGNSLRPLLVK